MPKKIIFDMTPGELGDWVRQSGQPSFRTQQILQWLYQRRSGSFEEMSNLSKDLRAGLNAEFSCHLPEPFSRQYARTEDTEKVLFQFEDQEGVETVKMPRYAKKIRTDPDTGVIDHPNTEAHAYTLCLSTQAGCLFACRFCASGQRGLERHLSCGEIISQVMYFIRQGAPVTRIVFMGTGEPLHNVSNVKRAVELLCHAEGLGFSPRSITLSTVGLVPEIYRIAKEQWKTKLAVSLHATTDETRSQLIPLAKEYELNQLMEALHYYYRVNGRRITFEYLMLDGVNDSQADAKRLVRYCESFPVLVNLIPFNAVSRTAYRPSPKQRIHEFQRILRAAGIDATVRYSRGRSIDAACGQLRLHHAG